MDSLDIYTLQHIVSFLDDPKDRLNLAKTRKNIYENILPLFFDIKEVSSRNLSGLEHNGLDKIDPKHYKFIKNLKLDCLFPPAGDDYDPYEFFGFNLSIFLNLKKLDITDISIKLDFFHNKKLKEIVVKSNYPHLNDLEELFKESDQTTLTIIKVDPLNDPVIFAQSYSFLRIMSGMAGLSYSN